MSLIALNALQVLNRSGTGYYSRKLVENLPYCTKGHDLIAVLPQRFASNPICSTLAQRKNVRLMFVRFVGQMSRILYEQTVLPRVLAKQGVELVHSMAFTAPMFLTMKSVVTVHDLAYRLFPDTLPAFRRVYLEKFTGRACEKADRVITVSLAAANDVRENLSVPQDKIAVVHEGGLEGRALNPQVEKEHLRRLVGENSSYVLSMGTMEPRKNLARLIEAFSLVRSELEISPKLVVVGRKGWMTEDVRTAYAEANLCDAVIWTGFLPTSVVLSLMKNASLYVMPSLYEGFGLPLVTAMSYGTPIAASDAGSIPEVVGDAAALFDPYDVRSIADAVIEALRNPEVLRSLTKRGKERSNLFSWRKCAEETVEVYEEALSA